MCISGQMLIRGTVNLLIGACVGGFEASHFTSGSVGSIAYLAIFGTLVGYTSYAYLLRNVKLTTAATYVYVNSVVAVLLGWLMLGEALATGEWAGLLFVLASVAIVVSAKPKRRVARTANPCDDSRPGPVSVQHSRLLADSVAVAAVQFTPVTVCGPLAVRAPKR